jgi:protein TonB
LIKKVNPVYPADARNAYIQGRVLLQAEISKTGDIVDLELVDGPIELAGSSVAAVRQWKYKPYLLMGQPVAVETQIQVIYSLRP